MSISSPSEVSSDTYTITNTYTGALGNTFTLETDAIISLAEEVVDDTDTTTDTDTETNSTSSGGDSIDIDFEQYFNDSTEELDKIYRSLSILAIFIIVVAIVVVIITIIICCKLRKSKKSKKKEGKSAASKEDLDYLKEMGIQIVINREGNQV